MRDIKDLLGYLNKGKENAISKKELIDLTGYNDRDIRLAVAKLRQEYPILSNTKTGGYYLPDDGIKGLKECDEFVMEQTSREKEIRKSMTAVQSWIKETINKISEVN